MLEEFVILIRTKDKSGISIFMGQTFSVSTFYYCESFELRFENEIIFNSIALTTFLDEIEFAIINITVNASVCSFYRSATPTNTVPTS